MKKQAIAALITAGMLTLAACSDNGSETVVETKAGDITKEEFYEELKDRYGEQILGELVTIKVLEDNYEVTDEMIDNELNAAKEQFGDDFELVLQQSGFASVEEYEEILYISLLQEQALSEDIEVTDEEIEERYERLKIEIDAQHILVADEKTAKQVLKKLNDGDDFGELAAEYSMDPGSAENDGKLGYFSTGTMVPEFENAVYSMDEGDISDPVQSEHGFHIIKVNDKRKTKEEIGELEDMRDEIRREIQLSKMDMSKANEKIDQLIQEADVNVKVEGLEDLFTPIETENEDIEE